MLWNMLWSQLLYYWWSSIILGCKLTESIWSEICLQCIIMQLFSYDSYKL